MINTASKLYAKLFNIYKTQYDKLSEDSKKMITALSKPEMLSLDFIEDGLPPMPPLESDKETKLEPEVTIAEIVKLNPWKRKNKVTGLDVLTPNKWLTRLPVLLAQIKAGNYSNYQTNTISFVSAK